MKSINRTTNNTIIECNLCALKKPNGETRRRNKRSCGKCILRAMYARDTLEQAYPGKYPWRDLCKIYIYPLVLHAKPSNKRFIIPLQNVILQLASIFWVRVFRNILIPSVRMTSTMSKMFARIICQTVE